MKVVIEHSNSPFFLDSANQWKSSLKEARLNQQLQSEAAAHVKQTQEILTSMRLMRAMREAKPLDTKKVIQFPQKFFTLGELKAANPTVSPEDITMQLAFRVSLRQLEYFPVHEEFPPSASVENDGNPFLYKVADDVRPKLCAA